MKEFVLTFIGIVRDGEKEEFAREEYFTGRVLDRWPEHSSNPDRAYRFDSKQTAQDLCATFAHRNLIGQVKEL